MIIHCKYGIPEDEANNKNCPPLVGGLSENIINPLFNIDNKDFAQSKNPFSKDAIKEINFLLKNKYNPPLSLNKFSSLDENGLFEKLNQNNINENKIKNNSLFENKEHFKSSLGDNINTNSIGQKIIIIYLKIEIKILVFNQYSLTKNILVIHQKN